MNGMSTFSETAHPRNHPSNAGAFSEKNHSAPENLLPEVPYWAAGGPAHNVGIIESPVSDRDRNYSLTFAPGGYLVVNPLEFGIAHPDSGSLSDRDRLYVGAVDEQPGTLQLQFSTPIDEDAFDEPGYLAAAVSDLGDDELADIEHQILDAVHEQLGPECQIQFSSGGDRWDDLEILFTTEHETDPAQSTHAGHISAFTSNLMAELEDNPTYRRVLAGAGTGIFNDILQKADLL